MNGERAEQDQPPMALGIGLHRGKLTYGVSITDACIDWDTTAELLRDIAATVAPNLEARNRIVQSA